MILDFDVIRENISELETYRCTDHEIKQMFEAYLVKQNILVEPSTKDFRTSQEFRHWLVTPPILRELAKLRKGE